MEKTQSIVLTSKSCLNIFYWELFSFLKFLRFSGKLVETMETARKKTDNSKYFQPTIHFIKVTPS